MSKVKMGTGNEQMLAFARKHGIPGHGGIEPDRQRATALSRFVIGRPVSDLAGGGVGLLMLPCYPTGFTR